MATSIPLADYLRAAQIDNFAIEGDHVRIGGRIWRASRCGCGEPGCDGWQVMPAPLPAPGQIGPGAKSA